MVLELQTNRGASIKASHIASNEGGQSQGFSCVNRVWLAQCQTFDQVADTIADEQRKREDILCPASALSFSVDGLNVVANIDGRAFKPTEHAYKDLCRWAANTPQTYFNYVSGDTKRDIRDVETLATVLENGRRKIDPEKQFRFRTYSDGTLRAMLSLEYKPIDNMWLVDVYRALMPDALFSHWRGNADDIGGNLLIPDNVRSEGGNDYGGLISIGNSEIGRRRFRQTPSIFSWVCRNGCIWDQEEGYTINMVHKGEPNYVELREMIATNINDQIPLVASAIDRLLATRLLILPRTEVKTTIAQIAVENNLTSSQAVAVCNEFVIHYNGHVSLFGIIDAVTRAGQTFDDDTWIKFDEIGGKLLSLNGDGWNTLRQRGKLLDTKRIEKLFSVAG